MGAIVELEGLTKKFGNLVAVDNLSFEIEKGEFFGLVGRNAAGKSTTLNMLTGVILPTDGRARIAGYWIPEEATKVKLVIGYAPQLISIYPHLTARENLDFFADIYEVKNKEERIEEISDILNLEEHLDRVADHLSGGMKQRLSLACSIIHKPKVLFLDEPFTGQDVVMKRSLWAQFRRLTDLGMTIVAVTHGIDEIGYFDRVAVMSRGRLVYTGKPDDLIKEVPCILEIKVDKITESMLLIVRKIDGVIEVTSTFNKIRVYTKDPKGTSNRIKKKFSSLGFKILNIDEICPTIEDAFIYVTEVRK